MHHLIEKPFAERLEIKAADIPSIVLTRRDWVRQYAIAYHHFKCQS